MIFFLYPQSIQDGVGSIRIRTELVINLARNLPLSGGGDASTLRLLSASLSELSAQVAPADDTWRDGVLDKWGRKIAAAEGGGISATTFKAFDSSISGLLKHTISTGKHATKSRKQDKSSDEEIDDRYVYNDADLYRALLVEIIDSGNANASTADAIASKTSLISKKKSSKKKRTNNANGRKLKYIVHEKLVGFLTPVPLPEPGPVNEILSTLFGGR